MPTSLRTTPPSALLTSAPAPPPRLLGVRPVLAGLAILAVGIPAVLLLPGPARQSAIPPARPTAARPAPVTPPSDVAQAPRPTLGPVVLVPKSTPHSPAPVAKAARPTAAHSPASAQPTAPSHQPPAWIRSECARRYPHDAIRRSACVNLLTAAFAH